MTFAAPIDTASKNITALRTAFAINRGMEMMENGSLQEIVRKSGGRKAPDRFQYLADLYSEFHKELYKDWGHESGVGGVEDGEDRGRLREIFHSLSTQASAGKNGKNASSPMLDSNGYFITYDDEKAAKVLADFSTEMLKFKPFAYGNQMTLSFFLAAFSEIGEFKGTYPAGIDFRRLDEKDTVALHDYNRSGTGVSIEAVETAFLHAMDGSRTPRVFNSPDSHKQFDTIARNNEVVRGISFLSHTDEDGTKYLVTVKGTMAPLNVVLPSLKDGDHPNGRTLADYLTDKIDHSGLNLADYISIPNDVFRKDANGKPVCLPGTEHLQDKTIIDNLPIPTSSTPLLCMGTNIITGLGRESHNDLESLIEKVTGEKTVFKLNQKGDVKGDDYGIGLRDRLHQTVDKMYGDPDQKDTANRKHRNIDIAYERVNLMTKHMDEQKDTILAEKEKDTGHDPLFVMSMGGSGSGKASVKDAMIERIIAMHDGALTKKDAEKIFVEASLDEYRKLSDQYTVINAAQHHADDYLFIEPFAKELRTWVSEGARKEGLHVLYDGSGVPYEGKYDKLVKTFKDNKDANGIAQRPYYTVVDAVWAPPEEALRRVQKRGEETGRYMPWGLAEEKHEQFPAGVRDAVNDCNLDEFLLSANDGARGTPRRLIAQSTNDTVQQSKGNTYLLSMTNGRTRGFLIHDVACLNTIMRGSQINTAASSFKDLWVPPEKTKFLHSATAQPAIGPKQQPFL